jgi:hypothetical protein
MRWQIGWLGVAFATLLFGLGLFLGSQRRTSEPIHSTAGERLQPAVTGASESATSGTVYVPVSFTLQLGLTRAMTVDLAALSVFGMSASRTQSRLIGSAITTRSASRSGSISRKPRPCHRWVRASS